MVGNICCLVPKLNSALLQLQGLQPARLLLSTGFPRQEYWSGPLFPSPGDIPDPGIKPASPVLAARFFNHRGPQGSLVGNIVISTLQMKRLKLKEIKFLLWVVQEEGTGVHQLSCEYQL